MKIMMIVTLGGIQKMGAALKQEELYTVAYIESLPEGELVELIDGTLFTMECPTTTHQQILTDLLVSIHSYIKKKGGDCQVFPAPYGIYILNDDHNYVIPDITVICDPAKIDEKGCHGAPDWVIEIVSPSSRTMDYMRKLSLYRQAGVRLYWIVDTGNQQVTVHDFAHDTSRHYAFTDAIPVSIYDDLTIRIA